MSGKKEEAENTKIKVNEINNKLEEIEAQTESFGNKIKEIMIRIPNIIDNSVPIRKR